MDIKELKSKGLQKEFNIKIPPKDITEKLNNKLLEISKTVSVDGFRKGNVPANILKQKFGQEALGQILDEAIKVSSNELIQKKKLKLALKPKVEVKQFGEEKGLEYTIVIHLLPEIQIQGIKDIKLTKFVSDVDDNDLNKTLENIAKHQQTFEKKENKEVENGDAVLINMSASYNGKNIKEAELNNKLTVLGNNMMFPDIEKKILNKKAGDKLLIKTLRLKLKF
jgi:trigger factor